MSGRGPLSRNQPGTEWVKALADRYFQGKEKGPILLT